MPNKTLVPWAKEAKSWRDWLAESTSVTGVLYDAAESLFCGSWAGSSVQSCYRVKCQDSFGNETFECLVIPECTGVMRSGVKDGDCITITARPDKIVVEIYREWKRRGGWRSLFRGLIERQIVHRYEASLQRLESKILK